MDSQTLLSSPKPNHLNPLETQSTFFEVGESSNTNIINQGDSHSKVSSLVGAHTTPPLEPSPSTTVPIAPQPSLVTSLKKQIQISKKWLSNLSRLNKLPPTRDHVTIFMAEAETEEDILFQFRNWTTEEEDRQEY